MADETRRGRSSDDRDVAARTRGRAHATGRDRADGRATASETDRIGREAQRRATAYARARGQL
jgi:hypothetical protein